jgi:hypothetical protein
MMNGKRPEWMFPYPNLAEMYKSLKDDEHIIFDIESGYPYRVTREYYEWYMKLYEATIPKAFRDNIKPLGTVWITGTGGEGFSKCSDAREMFYNPEKYNIVENGDSKTN